MDISGILGQIFGAIIYLLFSWAKEPVDDVFEAISGDDGLIEAIRESLTQFASRVQQTNSDIVNVVLRVMGNWFGQTANSFGQSLSKARISVQNHVRYVATQIISFGSPYVGWRILGALISFIFLLAFIYADLAQGLNNLSGIEAFSSYVPPAFFRNLAIPVVVSSAISAAALSLILFDLLGVTHFAPWEILTGRARKIVVTVVIGDLIASVFVAGAIALSRVPALFPDISTEIAQYIDFLVAFAQSAVSFLLVLTTVFMFWGFAGLLLIYIAILGAIILLIGFIEIAGVLVGVVFRLLVGLLLAMIRLFLFVLELVLVAFTMVLLWLVKVILLVQKVIDFLTYPIREIIGRIRQRSSST